MKAIFFCYVSHTRLKLQQIKGENWIFWMTQYCTTFFFIIIIFFTYYFVLIHDHKYTSTPTQLISHTTDPRNYKKIITSFHLEVNRKRRRWKGQLFCWNGYHNNFIIINYNQTHKHDWATVCVVYKELIYIIVYLYNNYIYNWNWSYYISENMYDNYFE